jgi:hypothetical protein
MAGSSRQHRSEKRRKELARQAKQTEKRERKTSRDDAGRGAGPPIDWAAATAAAPGADGETAPGEKESA